ncbi:MAG: Crp/Fnr family transcriptional regulator [Candidatus Marinimicrobia bacterium]|nr:Crp/Fnr family transcriptional regulator [Candidatus Neomarinimicrobiota bacterium]
MSICEILSKNRLFKEVDVTTIRQLLEGIGYKKLLYEKDDIIVMDGDWVTGQYIMLSGEVRGEMNNYAGKIVKIEDIKGYQLLAPAFLFGQDNRYPVDIIASKKTECIFIVRSDFSRLLQMDLTVQNNFLDIVSGKAQFLSNKIKFLALQPIKGKIASYLLKRTRNSLLNTIDLPYSQDNLADLFGVTRPALTRALRELDQNKIICAKGKRMCVLDKEKLKSFIQ